MGGELVSTLESGLGGESDLFLDERLNTAATCVALVDAGTVVAGRPLVDADCDHVGRAFDTVGISVPYEIGWTRFSSGLFGSHTEVAVRQGTELYRGCTIANHILRGEDDSGEVKESDVADGMIINFAGEWGANVTFRAAATDPTQRAVTYRMWTEWFNTGVVDVTEVYAKPAGVTDEECRTLPGTHRRAMYSADRVSHWATFFNGGKGDDLINAGRRLPAGCVVDAVLGQHYHDWGVPEGGPAASLNHEGEHGFRINRSVADPERDLDVSVHWWHEGFTSIKVRVMYVVHEPDGWDCMVTGLQDSP